MNEIENEDYLDENLLEKIVYIDEGHLPIPVTSHSRPSNPHHFLIHIILSLGNYDTEIDALTHASIHECLIAVGLIGNDDDVNQLQK